MTMDLGTIIAGLHDSEINGAVSWVYNDVWTVQLGDAVNEVAAEAVVGSAQEAAEWLRANAVRRYRVINPAWTSCARWKESDEGWTPWRSAITPAGNSAGDQQSEHREPGFLGERTERCNRAFLIHSRGFPYFNGHQIIYRTSLVKRHFDHCRNNVS